jgi:hypothetical protein
MPRRSSGCDRRDARIPRRGAPTPPRPNLSPIDEALDTAVGTDSTQPAAAATVAKAGRLEAADQCIKERHFDATRGLGHDMPDHMPPGRPPDAARGGCRAQEEARTGGCRAQEDAARNTTRGGCCARRMPRTGGSAYRRMPRTGGCRAEHHPYRKMLRTGGCRAQEDAARRRKRTQEDTAHRRTPRTNALPDVVGQNIQSGPWGSTHQFSPCPMW